MNIEHAVYTIQPNYLPVARDKRVVLTHTTVAENPGNLRESLVLKITSIVPKHCM